MEALLAQEVDALEKQRSQVRAWRMRAEELRATADQVPSAQETLRRAAANCAQMADYAEALLTRIVDAVLRQAVEAADAILLVKPFSPRKLVALVSKALSGRLH